MDSRRRHVVVVGGGFGGLYAARALPRLEVSITVIDRRNFHLFQPLLYQVATGGLSPADIASPLRAVLRHLDNVRVIQAEVRDVEPVARKVILEDGTIPYDFLILATGATHHYFGNDGWAPIAPGLKTIEDATLIRRQILEAYEKAEREPAREKQRAHMTFVIVGGGPTGVEMAGAIGELARQTMRNDFRAIDPIESRILLVEATGRILPTYPENLSRKAAIALGRLGVEVMTDTMVTALHDGRVALRRKDAEETVAAATVIWAAGVKASRLGRALSQQTGANLDKFGRVVVEPDCSVPGFPEIFVIGDLAHYAHPNGAPLPGVAPVAMQQGQYLARVIQARLEGKAPPPFRYRNKGSLAVIGRAAAVAQFGRFKLWGYPAWLTWLFVHLMYLVGYQNRLLVLIQWAWSYITKNRGARLITGTATLD